MRLRIDTELKVIKIEGNVGIKELFDTMMKMFPDWDYEGWSIHEYMSETVDWSKLLRETQTLPFTTPAGPYTPNVPGSIGPPYTNPPHYPPHWGTVTCGSGNTPGDLKSIMRDYTDSQRQTSIDFNEK